MISQMIPAGPIPPSRARSTEASVCPARTSTPPLRARSGNTCPGRAKSDGRVAGSMAVRMVYERSYAEIPVVTPSRASIASQKAVPYCDVFSLVMGPMRRWSSRSSVIARQTRPRPCLAMKLIASGVTFSAASVRSPSFSRSSSSMTTIIRPARISSAAVGTSVKGELGVMEKYSPRGNPPSAAEADVENKSVAAALKRCATQNQGLKPLIPKLETARLKSRPFKTKAKAKPKQSQNPNSTQRSKVLRSAQIAPLRRREFVLLTHKQVLQNPRHSPNYPSHRDHDRGQKSGNDQGSRNRVPGSKPRQEYCERVFSRAEREIRNRLGRRGHGSPRSRLCSLRRQGDRPARQRRQQLLFWRKLRRRAIGDQGRHRNSNKCVQGIPEQIESRDFVSEQLNRKKHAGGRNYPPTGKQMQPGRQVEQAGVGQKSECGHRGIHVETGREAYRHDQTDEFGAAKLHACQHIRTRPPL